MARLSDPLDAGVAVLKFGGSAFADLSGYHHGAGYVADRVAQGRRVVVVVSAMSGTTGKLQEALRDVHESPTPAVSSLMLTTGELVSVALMAAAVERLGVSAVGLNGNQLGLTVDGPTDRARLCAIDPTPLRGALTEASVVVVPGGQAADDRGNTVMLGRNSSDLSAVAAAVAVGAESCEIFSDVLGVCSADPYLVPTARTLPRVSYESMLLFARAGAKVLHGHAVGWAQEYGVRIICRSLPPEAMAATTIGVGPPVAAALLHERGDVWRFDDEAARESAATELVAEGLDANPVDADERYLVVTHYGNATLARRCCAEGEPRPELWLLTVLHEDGSAEQVILPRSDGRAELIRRHDQLYRDQGPSGAISRKARSGKSGLLLGSRGI